MLLIVELPDLGLEPSPLLPEAFPFSHDLPLEIEDALGRVRDDFTEADRCFSRAVFSSDIDYGNHMNNVAYVKTMLDTFSSAELAALPIKSFEIRYGEPCREGETIAIYRRETDGGCLFAIKKENGKTAATAVLRTM